jgi:hypothetical protein
MKVANEGVFRISFYPKWSLEDSDCFMNSCPTEQVYNIYLDEVATGKEICYWAESMLNRTIEEPFLKAVDNAVEVSWPAFFKIFFGPNCMEDLSPAVTELLIGESSLPVVEINVIEKDDLNISDYLCFSAPSSCRDTLITINFVLPDWCDSTCLPYELPTCENCVNGFCLGDDQCHCNSGYTGANCNIYEGCRVAGCVQGDCLVNGICQCDEGYTGAICNMKMEQEQ